MININTQDKQVADYLKSAGIKYQVIPIQQGAKDADNWEHDKWLTIFNSQSFDYMTGIGHRIAYYGFGPDKKTRGGIKALREITGYTDKLPETKELRLNPNKSSINFEGYARAVPPTQASVLYSLLLDSEASNESFKNWCDNYGYDIDSVSAQKIYFACQENADKLNRLLSHKQIEDLRKLLEDY